MTLLSLITTIILAKKLLKNLKKDKHKKSSELHVVDMILTNDEITYQYDGKKETFKDVQFNSGSLTFYGANAPLLVKNIKITQGAPGSFI